jgi:hypothetical protein
MKIISHRGNLTGPNKSRENSPDYIEEAMTNGYDVEVDLRMKGVDLYLGHDEPQYSITKSWITDRKKMLWVHTKDKESLLYMVHEIPDAQFFYHERERYTIVSNGLVWAHDFSLKLTDKCIVPTLSLDEIEKYNGRGVYALCTDYVAECERKFIGAKYD